MACGTGGAIRGDSPTALCFLDAEPPVMPGDIVSAAAAAGVASARDRIVAGSVLECRPAGCSPPGNRGDGRDLECTLGLSIGPRRAAMRVVVESELHYNVSALSNRAYSADVWRAFVAPRVEPIPAR